MSAQLSAPHRTALKAINIISQKSCRAFSARGSDTSRKRSCFEPIAASIQAAHQRISFPKQRNPKTRNQMRFACPKGGILVLTGISATAVGFVATAPYVVVNFDAYLGGVEYLRNQYTEGHPPHSYKEYDVLQSVQHVIVFIGLLFGPIVLFPLLAFLKPYSDLMIGLALFGILNVLYFSTVPVFFERNISLALTALLVSGAMAGARYRSTVLIGALCSVWMAYWSIQIAADSRERGPRPDRHADWATSTGLQSAQVTIEFAGPVGLVENCQDRIGLMHFGDEYSASSISQLGRAGHLPIAVYHGRYRNIPTSTLHTYLDTDIYYYQCGPMG